MHYWSASTAENTAAFPAYKRLDIVCRLFHEDCVSSCDIEYWMVVRPCREGPARGSEALLCVWSEKLGRESVSKSVGNGDFKAPSIVWISPDDRGLGSYIPAHHGCVSVFSTVSSVSTTSSASCRADLSVLSHSAIAPFLLFAVCSLPDPRAGFKPFTSKLLKTQSWIKQLQPWRIKFTRIIRHM